MRRILLSITLLLVASCGGNTTYILPEGAPTAMLTIGHDPDQIWSRKPYDLYLMKVADNCLQKSRLPISSAEKAAPRHRTAAIPAANEVTFLLDHRSPFRNASHVCKLLFSVDTTSNETYRLTFLHPRFETCGVRVERAVDADAFEGVPVNLLADRNVDDEELGICPE